MTKIKKFLSVEKIDFRKILFLSLLAVVLVSPFKAKAGVLQDLYNGLVDGFTAGTCTIDKGDTYCTSNLTYFPRGNYDRNFTISSHLEEKIEVEKKKILFGAVTYYTGKGKVEYKTTRFDLKDSKGKIVAQIHGYAIPTPSFLIELSKKDKNENISGDEVEFSEEKSPYSGKLTAKDCQIQNGSNSCPSEISFTLPKNYDDSFIIKSEFGDEVKTKRKLLTRRTYIGLGITKQPTTNFIAYDNEGRIMNTATAKASCKDEGATSQEGYCLVGEESGNIINGDNDKITFYAEPGTCKIDEGGKSCQTKLVWDLTNTGLNPKIKLYETYLYTQKIQIFTTNEEGQRVKVYEGTFNPKKPYGSTSINVPYSGGVYEIAYNYRKETTDFSSLKVSAECREESKWNGNFCVGYVTTGFITPEFSSCQIAEGQSKCQVEISWQTEDPAPLNKSKVKIGGTLVEESDSGTKKVAVGYPEATFTLEHKNKVLDTAYANSYCVAGTFWNGSNCETPECPEYKGPDDSYKAEWKDPTCGDTCSKEDCSRWDSTKIIKCTTANGKTFTYDCCQKSE
jgi:hypothetical protein